jgi:chromate transport protein ChrA
VLHGPEAQQLATYIGWPCTASAAAPSPGSCSCPGFVAMLALSAGYAVFGPRPDRDRC